MNSRVLQGRYLLHHQIGSGGMGAVHLGTSLGEAGFRRRVAIKRLRHCYAHDPRLRALFVDEARLAGHVNHANVVATLDVLSESGELFLVMEYVAGETLAALFRAAFGRVPAAIAAALVLDTLQGLHAIHEARGRDGKPLGLVHRDVSPHNVMAGLDGAGYVLDFGIARPSSDTDETRNDDAGGKLAYMAPESVLSGEVTRRSDIYAVGLVLWEALTGRRFRDGASAADLIRQAHGRDVTAPSSLAPRLQAGLDEVVLKACAREPSERYATAFEMAVALEAACPAATRVSVGAWVHELAGEAIERRTTIDVHGAPTVMPPARRDRPTMPAPAAGQGEGAPEGTMSVPVEALIVDDGELIEGDSGAGAAEGVKSARSVAAPASSNRSLAPSFGMFLPAFGLLSRRGSLAPSDPAEDTRLHARRVASARPAPFRSRPAAAPPPLAQVVSTESGPESQQAEPPQSFRQEMRAVARHPNAEQSAPPVLPGAEPSAPPALANAEQSAPPATTDAERSTPPVPASAEPSARPVLADGEPSAPLLSVPGLLAPPSLPIAISDSSLTPADALALLSKSAAMPAASLVTGVAPVFSRRRGKRRASRPEVDSLSGLQYGAEDARPGVSPSRESARQAPLLDRAGVPRLPKNAFGVAAFAAIAVVAMMAGRPGDRSSASGGRAPASTLVVGAPGAEPGATARDATRVRDVTTDAEPPAPPPAAPAPAPAPVVTSAPAAPSAPAAVAPAAPAAAPAPVAPSTFVSRERRAATNPTSAAHGSSPTSPQEGKAMPKAFKAAAGGCDPPIFVDADGNRHLKPHCVQRDD